MNRHFLAAGLLAAAAWAMPSLAEVSDARRYCAQVRDDDTIRQLPRSLAAEIMGDKRTSDEIDFFVTETYFRCMNGLVFYCSIGANNPCTSKADTERHRPDIDRYCRKERNLDFVPMAVTGHATMYSWSCVKGRAVITDQMQLDKQGFQAELWTPLLK
jgi:hypothetical protein